MKKYNKTIFLFIFILSFSRAFAQEPEQDCFQAIPICQISYSQDNSYSGEGANSKEIPAGSCLSTGEKNSVWYTLTVQSDGNLGFNLTAISLDDYDWAVYNLTNATCADIPKKIALEVSCNYAKSVGLTGPNGTSTFTSQGSLGTLGNALIPVLKGEIYAINISNFDGSADGYVLDFSPSSAGIIDVTPPNLVNIVAPINCGSSALTLKFNENVFCNTIEAADFSISGGSATYKVNSVVSANCVDATSYTREIKLNISPAFFAGEQLTLNLVGKVADLCGNNQDTGKISFSTPKPFSVTNGHVDNCISQTLELNANVTGNGSPFLYTFIFDGITLGQNINTNKIQFVTDSAGVYSYQIIVKDKFGCMQISSDSIRVFGNAQSSFIANQKSPLNYDFIASGKDIISYSWDFGDGGLSDNPNPNYKYANEGNYDVILITMNQDGCYDTVLNKIIATNDFPPNTESYLNVPSAFSPDGNSLNAVFKVDYSGLSQFEIRVFDRWGKLIFNSKDPDFNWEGSGQFDGIYPYIINAKFFNGEEFFKKGTVAITR